MADWRSYLKKISKYTQSLKYKNPPASTIIVSERKLLKCIGIIGHGKLATFLLTFYSLCYISVIVKEFFNILLKSGNLNELVGLMIPFIGALHCILKLWIFYLMRHQLVEVIDDLQIFWNQRIGFGKTDKIVAKANVKAERIVVGYTFLMVYVTINYAMRQVITLIFKTEEVQEKTQLSINSESKIFDILNLEDYIIYNLIQVVTSLFTSIALSAVDLILVVLLLHLSAHFKSLGKEFNTLGTIKEDDEDNDELEEWNKNAMPLTDQQEKDEFEKLKKYIDRHNDLINTVNKLENVSSNVSLIHFLYSSITMCLILFQINANKRDTKALLPFLAYLVGTTLQFYMFAFYGQKIIDESSEIANETYCCEWYRFSPKFRKSLVKVIQRSQRPCRLTAAKFYKVSVESFSMVMSAAGSYYTLLNSLSAK